jgi:DNA repair exonuclease SbcCD ATPase subunit
MALQQMERIREDVISDTREGIEKRANLTIRSIDPDAVLGDLRIHPVSFRLGREKKGKGETRVIPMAFLSAGEREILALSILSSFPLLTGGSLILDSPFPHLDAKRRKRLLNALPELADRVYLSLPQGSLSVEDFKELTMKWEKTGRGFMHYLLEPVSGGSILKVLGGDSR